MPIAIKDEVDVVGEVNLHGTDAFEEPAKADSEVVRRLREAGAIVVGLTLLPELAICGFTESATYGVSRNPWNPQRTPGGSSGGSGAAVAAGIVALASAGDGAGSIRIPAACNGLFGLKPSRGRVSLAPRRRAGAGWRSKAASAAPSSTPRSGSTSSPAAPTRTRRRRRPSAPSSSTRWEMPGTLRVGYSTLPPRAIAPPTVSEEVKAATIEAARFLGTLGHNVGERDPDWGRIGDTITARFLKGVAETVEEVPLPERLERRTRGFGKLGGLLPESLYQRAMANRPAEIARVNAIFDEVDVLVMPVMGGTASRSAAGRAAAPSTPSSACPASIPTASPGTTWATRRCRSPSASAPTACHWRSRSSAGPARRGALFPGGADRARAAVGRARPPIS